MSLSGPQAGNFSVGHVLAVLGILFAAAYGGAAGGSIAGVASGVFFSLATSGLSYLSAGYAMGGLTAGLFSPGEGWRARQRSFSAMELHPCRWEIPLLL